MKYYIMIIILINGYECNKCYKRTLKTNMKNKEILKII